MAIPKFPMNTVIASRSVERRKADGTVAYGLVEIGTPTYFVSPTFTGYYCVVRITNVGWAEPRLETLYGFDGIGALSAALHIAGVILTTSPASSEISHPNFSNNNFPVLDLVKSQTANP